MNLIYLVLLCGLIGTRFGHTLEASLHAESIVGGNVAAVRQNTYAVSIQVNGRHFCGGAILNNRYIITVAHCFINVKTNTFDNDVYFVVVGDTHAHNKEERYRVTREVAKIYVPREYNPRMVSNIQNRKFADIAVLELKSELVLNQFITHVVLPPDAALHSTYEDQRAVVTGYGDNWVNMRHDEQTNKDVECTGSNCSERRFAYVTILPNMKCQHFYRDIMNSQLCGKMRQRSPATPEGLCTGDSGAPLVIGGNTIIGVVCGSPPGCREDLEPAIYTRVTSFIPFIRNAMNGVRTEYMRLAEYEVKKVSCGIMCNRKVLVEH